MIPYGKHTIDASDIEAVVEVLSNEFLTQGQRVPAFEGDLCSYTGAQYAVAVNSGTSGLHIACLAAGVGKGDLVWTVPNSFAASANCARYCGADVDFVDIDPVSRNMCLIALERKLQKAKQANRLPCVIVVVHFAGSSCDMQAISSLCKPLGIVLIEDAAHALGARDPQGSPVGQCAYSDMTVLSFHPVKSITTAEGGAVTTNQTALATSLRLYASHGISRDPDLMRMPTPEKPWRYEQLVLGYNYRLSDIHAALGSAQLKRLDAFIKSRRERAERYQEALIDLPVKLPQWDERSAWHLYVIQLINHDRTDIFNQLRDRGIGVNVHYIPIHWHPYYQSLGFRVGDFEHAEKYYAGALTLPLFPELTADMQDEVIKQVKEVLR